MADLSSQLVSALAGRYVVGRQLGRGGMATVFLARDVKHDRDVAIKVLHPELAAAVPAERFLREIRIEAKLQHPHVVTLLDSGTADGLLYYVMPYIEGESLRQRLIAGRLDVGEAMRLWRDVVDAIAYAHRHGITHRDIKPENVLLSDRHALVVDFGIAKALSEAVPGETLTSAGLAVGTPAYMSPEQVAGGGDVDHRADIYALGLLAYEMLAGRAPFAGSTAQSFFVAHLSEDPTPLRELRADVSPEVEAIVQRCMRKDPDQRWSSADELLTTLDSLATPALGTLSSVWKRVRGTRRSRRRLAAALTAAALLLTVGAYSVTAPQRRVKWAREIALPELRRHSDARTTDSAFILASRVREILPRDAEVAALWNRNSVSVPLTSSPAGARVSWTAFRGDTSGWAHAGVTPLDSVAVPAPAFQTFVLIKFEKPGFFTAIYPFPALRGSRAPVVLDSSSVADTGMVRVHESTVLLAAGDAQPVSIPVVSFAIDRHEVTNEEFKRFVDDGGYRRRDLWEHPFASAGQVLSWDAAMRRFTDRTGRVGPATWEGGDVPRGPERFPVSGISWYEAAAYAKYAGKQLPTVHQWRAAAGTGGAAWVVPRSNMESNGMRPVGSGVGPYGTFDMAGNAREWCVNPDGNRRHILGGAWNDLSWAFTHTISDDPFDRSETNGMRLVKALERDTNAALLAGPAPRGYRDYARERPVSEAEFRSLVRIYDYDRTPLNATVEATDSTNRGFIKQTITFDAVYGAPDRVKAYLMLPRGFSPPYQTIVSLPGGNAFVPGSSESLTLSLPFLLSTGRAVMYPVLKNTFERSSDAVSFLSGPVHNMSGDLLGPNTYRDEVVMMLKDLRRSVDYLFTRADVDTAKLAYAGYSWGARIAPISLAVEPRFKTGVLYLGGLMSAPRRPEVDEVNFLPRVKLPVLVLSGKYDDVFPLETMAAPYVRGFGTPAEHKEHVVYPTQHFLPRDQQITATLNWLDRYLGRVTR